MYTQAPTFEDLLIAYIGPTPERIRYGESDYYAVEEDPYGDGYVLIDLETDEIIFHEPADTPYKKLANHARDCEVTIDAYLSPDADTYYALDVEKIFNLAIACQDCQEVIYDQDRDFDEPLKSVDALDYM